MGKVQALVCVKCDRSYAEGEVLYTCPHCGPTGILDVRYDYDALAREGFGPERLAADPERTQWRYRDLLPIGDGAEVPPVPVGWTPVFPLPGLARSLGVAELWVKDEGRNPTASFKDRASSVAAVKARELGFDTVCCASTGNAASSLAGFAAQLGLRAFIFVPEVAPEAKVAQLLIFGATVFVVEGSYRDAYELCSRAAAAFGWYNRSAAINPVPVEGKKTAGLEIAEQFGDALPDWVSVSVGDGCTVAGVWKGLKEMRRFGVIDRLPRLLGTQAQGASPLVDAFQRGTESWEVREAHTVADSISVAEPRNGIKALRAVRESGGALLAVSDEEILAAERELAAHGVFAEPAAAASLAGLRRAREEGLVGPGDRVLCVVTGSGLKDVRAATEAARAAGRQPHRVAPALAAVREVVQG
ncbi:MAG TPA: threonine synthase [Actinomycetota bacterium]|nr:threonine synthase [Actinomycetota bacterium]